MLYAIPSVLVGLVLVIVLVAATRPTEFIVERSIELTGTPETVFAWVNDFHRWARWSPYDRRDPAMKKTYEGAESGVGARYGWSGNKQVGAGSMTITESSAPQHIVIALEFTAPFPGKNVARFSFEPKGSAVRVRWAITGRNPLPAKIFGLFVDMDRLIGRDFEIGLAALKELVEKEGAPRA
jgi:hypothetical protein